MFDIGGLELLVAAAIALIVLGPKDLTVTVRNIGRWVAKARQMAREFQQGMEDAAKEADVDDLRKIGTIKSDLEKQARDFGKSVMDDIEDDAPTRRAPRAPERRPREEPEDPGLVEPQDDFRDNEPEFAERPAPRRDRGREDRGPSSDVDDPLERFQRGMRGGD